MGRAEQAGGVSVRVASSADPGAAEEVEVELPFGATLLDALQASGVRERCPTLAWCEGAVGIWGRLRPLDTVLQAGDRVELYRPLEIDPKEARRRRQQRQREAGRPSGNRPR